MNELTSFLPFVLRSVFLLSSSLVLKSSDEVNQSAIQNTTRNPASS